MAILTTADVRARIPKLSDPAKFSDEDLEDLVNGFSRLAEDYRGYAFELRYQIEQIDLADAVTWLRLRWPCVRAVSSLTYTWPAVSGTTTTLVEDTDFVVDLDAGDVSIPGGIPAGARVTVAYTHGIGARTVTDGATTNNDASVTSETATFTIEDIGSPIAGTGIPTGTTIASVTSSTSIELSAVATATGTGIELTIGTAPEEFLRGCREYVRSCALADQSTVPRDVISQSFGDGGYTRYSTPDWAAGRPTGYLEVDRILNGLPDRRRIL